MRELLRVETLCAGYGRRQVLKDVSFAVGRGEMCVLLGANGSGKSTLLRALCGLTDASGGCRLLEADLWDMPARRRARLIGYLAQRSACELALSALDVVLMGCNPELGTFQWPGAQHRQRALALLAELGDASWAQAEYLSLSEGQRQLVLIARTLVRQPPLLLLDEPDSALDYPRRYGLLRWLKAYARREEAGVLLCSHDANIALRYADRLLLLGDGRLLDDVAMADADTERLREALGKIYGPVDVLRHGGTFLMTRGDAE